MLKLPAPDSPLRKLFDVAHLAAVAAPSEAGKLPTVRDARHSAQRELAQPSVRWLVYIVLSAAGEIVLVRFKRSRYGNTPSMKRLWVFGVV
jgi:hypothetical protein